MNDAGAENKFIEDVLQMATWFQYFAVEFNLKVRKRKFPCTVQ